MNKNLLTLFTLVSATTAGFAVGYLTAPRSGKKTRKMIKDELDNTRDRLEQDVTQKIQDFKVQLNGFVEDQMKNGKRSIDKTKEKIKVS